MGTFKREYKFIFYNLESLVDNNEITDDRYSCLLSTIAAHAKEIYLDEEPCDKFKEFSNGTERLNVSFSIFSFNLGLNL